MFYFFLPVEVHPSVKPQTKPYVIGEVFPNLSKVLRYSIHSLFILLVTLVFRIFFPLHLIQL